MEDLFGACWMSFFSDVCQGLIFIHVSAFCLDTTFGIRLQKRVPKVCLSKVVRLQLTLAAVKYCTNGGVPRGGVAKTRWGTQGRRSKKYGEVRRWAVEKTKGGYPGEA